MEQANALKQVESKLSLAAERVSVFQAKLEDLVFRAQKIARQIDGKQKVTDTMFGYELQSFRRDMRGFGLEVSALPSLLSSIEREAHPDPACDKSAEALSRIAQRVLKALIALHEHSLLAHTHIRAADYKIEAWYICQELDEMKQRAQALPEHATRLLRIISTTPT